MFDEAIKSMEMADLLKSENIYIIQSKPSEIREHLKALYFARLSELKADREIKDQVKRMFRAFDDAEKEMAAAYTRENARANSEIPLAFDGQGRPLSTINNFLLILQKDPYFNDLQFNQLSYTPEHIVDGKIERWKDKDDSDAKAYIESKYKLYNKDKLDDALRIFFSEREYHPIKQIIESVEWDGVSRIQTLFIRWLKCEDTPYIREVTRLVFAGGINRLYNPGCKFDDVVVLIGTNQGEGKSTFVRWLAIKDEFFTEVTEMDGQKGVEAIEGAWVCEIAELLAVSKSKEVEAVKSYITKLVDHYRKPYDKRTEDRKRQCIFIGTTNKEQFLTDKTGNRRWYPVKVNSIGYDLHDHKEEIQHDILQAWAEARHLFDEGKLKPYADRSMLSVFKERQNQAIEDDYRVGLIKAYLSNHEKVCIIEIWQKALKNEYTKPTRKESNEIALIIQGFSDWERCINPERFDGYGVQKCWKKKIKDKFDKLPQIDDNELPY